MSRPRVLVTSNVVQKYVGMPREDYDISLLTDHPDRDGWLREHGAGIQAVVAMGAERLDAARMTMMPDLRLIAVMAAGMSGIDLAEARRRGIAVTNAGDSNSGDVADMAVAMLLALRRDLVASDTYVRSGKWLERRMPNGRSVASLRVGIVGLGHIGRAIADRLVPFGCEIRWWGPNPKPDAPWQRLERLEELAQWANALIVAVSGKEDTRGLIDASIIDALGPEGMIVNIARGFVIDEPEMKAALRSGRLGQAALDVFHREPDSGADWADMQNVLLAPHVAGATAESMDQVTATTRENVRRFFAGEELLNRVV